MKMIFGSYINGLSTAKIFNFEIIISIEVVWRDFGYLEKCWLQANSGLDKTILSFVDLKLICYAKCDMLLSNVNEV